MSDDAEAVVSAQAEPVTDATAAPVDAPVVGEESKPEVVEESAAPKTFTQDDVNEIVQKRLAQAERKLAREFERKIAEATKPAPQAVEPAAKPLPAQFQTTEEYVEAVAEWKADQILSKKLTELEGQQKQRAQAAQQEQVLSTYREREEQARGKYADFDEVAYNPQLPITDAMAGVIQHSDEGTDIAYYLGKNPAEAMRIAKLPPFLQATELGKLTAKIAAPTKPNVSSAPPPISPVTGRSGQFVVDTSDPKSLEKLGTSAWIAAERKRQTDEWKRAHG